MKKIASGHVVHAEGILKEMMDALSVKLNFRKVGLFL